jgi:hypothetical protein
LGGLLLHGVGIRRKGRGCLFLGLSGDGKTTIGDLSGPEEMISDDGIIVERRDKGHYLSPTPFDQKASIGMDPDASGKKRIRMAAGFLLQKDTRVSVDPILPAEACSVILKNHIHFFRYFYPETVKKAFELVVEMCRQTPFYRLHFRKEPSFWPLVDNRIFSPISIQENEHG